MDAVGRNFGSPPRHFAPEPVRRLDRDVADPVPCPKRLLAADEVALPDGRI